MTFPSNPPMPPTNAAHEPPEVIVFDAGMPDQGYAEILINW
jgi:hypothetical protein